MAYFLRKMQEDASGKEQKDVLDKLTPLYDKAREMVNYCKNPQDDLESHKKRYNALLMDLFDANLDVTELVTDILELNEGAIYVFNKAFTNDMRKFKIEVLDKSPEPFNIIYL